MPINEDEYNILIKTKSDNRGVKDTENALDKLGHQNNNKVGPSFLKLSTAVAAGTAAFHLAQNAVGGAIGFLSSSVKAYNEAETAQKQLEHAVVGVTHATQKQLDQTAALADLLEKKGVLDGDNIKVGLAQLSTFGLSNKAVQNLGKSLADLAVNQFGVHASGEQLSDTANMIAKALNGQFGVLEKSGIRFTKAQQSAIKFGSEMQKVKAINEGFAQNLKFTNEVALSTTEGKLAKLSVSYENIKERIGEVTVNAITPLIKKLADFVQTDQFQKWVEKASQWLEINLKNAINWLTNTGWPMLKSIIEQTWPVVKKAWEIFVGLVQFLSDHMWVFWSLVGVLGAIKLAFLINSAVTTFQSLMVIAGNAAGGLNSSLLIMAGPAGGMALLGVAAIATVAIICNEWKKASDAVNNTKNAIASAKTSSDVAVAQLNKNIKNIDVVRLTRAQQALGVETTFVQKGNTYVPRFASGVRNFGGGLAVVGEQGPELVNLPRGSSVYNNQESQNMSGTSNVYNIQNLNLDAGGTREFFKIEHRNNVLAAQGVSVVRI